jgi:hypothetical protein
LMCCGAHVVQDPREEATHRWQYSAVGQLVHAVFQKPPHSLSAPPLSVSVSPSRSSFVFAGAPAGSFLVTGGTGALGQLVATWVTARWGSADVCQLSRRGSGAPPSGHEGPTSGVTSVMRCDITDADEMFSLVNRGHFTDVIHAGTQCLTVLLVAGGKAST